MISVNIYCQSVSNRSDIALRRKIANQRSDRGEWKLKVADLRILPGMGKIKLTAGSPEWGTRGKRDLPHYATRFGVEILGERPLSRGYAFGITRG